MLLAPTASCPKRTAHTPEGKLVQEAVVASDSSLPRRMPEDLLRCNVQSTLDVMNGCALLLPKGQEKGFLWSPGQRDSHSITALPSTLSIASRPQSTTLVSVPCHTFA